MNGYLKIARSNIRDIFQEFSGIGLDNRLSLAETIKKISVIENSGQRSICTFVLRINSSTDNFPELITGKNINSIISTFAEKALPDICKRFEIGEKEQSHIKIKKLYNCYDLCCEKLSTLSQIPAKIDTICAQQQTIMKALNDKTLNSFLAPYEFSQTKVTISTILSRVVSFSKSSDNTFNRKFKELMELLDDEINLCQTRSIFIDRKYYKPFLEKVKYAIQLEANSAQEKFICEIKGRHGSKFTLDKKFPLHVVGKEIRIYMPAYNTGPGIAESYNQE